MVCGLKRCRTYLFVCVSIHAISKNVLGTCTEETACCSRRERRSCEKEGRVEGVCPGWFDAKKGVYLTASGAQAGFMRVKFLEGFWINFFHETERQRKKGPSTESFGWLQPQSRQTWRGQGCPGSREHSPCQCRSRCGVAAWLPRWHLSVGSL